MSITAILAFIFVFGIIVFVHELGHFLTAKISHVLVREFSIGMGPKLISFNRKGTAYSLRILPVGGYVRLAGQDFDIDEDLRPGAFATLKLEGKGKEAKVTQIDLSENRNLNQGINFQVDSFDLVDQLTLAGFENNDLDDKITYKVDHDALIIDKENTKMQIAPRDSQFQSAPLKNRMLINFAGAFMNFLLAILIFSVIGFFQKSVSLNEPIVGSVQKNMPAAEAGLQPKDEIISINGDQTKSWSSISMIINDPSNKELDIKVKRDGQINKFKITPKIESENGQDYRMIGIVAKSHTDTASRLKYGFVQTWQVLSQVVGALRSMLTNGFKLDDFGGPVAIAQVTSQASKNGFMSVLSLTALLSANIGLMQLLPIPGLDGGKLLLNIVEAIRRKPLSQRTEQYVTVAGVVVLFTLMIAVTINDLLR